MSSSRIAPYGSWRSPITADIVASGGVSLGGATLDGADLYWTEGRPLEGGRVVLVRRGPDGLVSDVTPATFNVRSRVHEYGGGAFAIRNGLVLFANFADGRLYRQDPGGAPVPLTPAAPDAGLRVADMAIDEERRRVICILEDHTTSEPEAVNTIVAVPLDPADEPGAARTLVSGATFYSTPRLSPDGRRLAWLSWSHPTMPWDGCELWVGDIAGDGSVENAARVAGGASESIFQPAWSPDGRLGFASDRTGWWNLYLWDGPGIAARPLCPMDAEFGMPQWVFGLTTFGFTDAQRILCRYTREGTWRLALLDLDSGALRPYDLPYTEYANPFVVPADGSRAARAAFVGASPVLDAEVVVLDVDTGSAEVVRRARATALDPRYLSRPEPIEFPTEGGLTAHGLFYPPRNADCAGPADERPPLLVKSHGGPTAAASSRLDPEIQFWTSRGIAVLDVNYGGSSGYGREFRQRLQGRWGIVDIDDCVNGARHLAREGRVDGDRLAIDGGSAGGFTTLGALAFRDVFRAGASYFGVADLETMARDTHKFESRYLDGLVGPYPERIDVYRERSPIHHLDGFRCPVILFQGLDDRVVPPNQAYMLADALRSRGMPVALLAFEGEGHGFRKAENIRRSLEAEAYFYARVFGFALSDDVEPVPIENL